MNFLKDIRERWKGHKEKQFLETHGCKTWREYHRKYDPDFSSYAGVVNKIYHGYPHVICIEDHTHYAYKRIPSDQWANRGCHEMEEWCYQMCENKFRVDWHRVVRNYWGKWEENSIGGGDYLFFAFKSNKDAVMFSLRWG